MVGSVHFQPPLAAAASVRHARTTSRNVNRRSTIGSSETGDADMGQHRRAWSRGGYAIRGIFERAPHTSFRRRGTRPPGLRLDGVHGVIFNSLRDYLVAEHGRGVAASVFAGQPDFSSGEAYPDESLLGLVELSAAETGRDRDEILFELGVFTGETTFARLYPGFFAAQPSPRAFLLTVERRIHEVVRATIPHAAPPRLQIEPLGVDRISITYDSPRRLCVLLRGLTEGAARQYGQHAELEESTCMLRGDAACTFAVGFSDGSPP